MSLLLLLTATQGTGAYTHSFPGIRPRARYDDTPWITVTVAESATRTGTYTDLVTQALDSQDSDPAHPDTRDVTVNGARLASGWYRFTFTDLAGDREIFDAIPAGPGIRPATQEVANLMPDRTTVDGGGEARTFNADTSPTATEVNALIDMVLDSVDPRVPDNATPEVMRAARHVVTLQTAILVESGNWGDQLETNESRVELWERLLTRHEATLDAAAQDDTAGHERFGSIPVLSPTLSARAGQYCCSTELLP